MSGQDCCGHIAVSKLRLAGEVCGGHLRGTLKAILSHSDFGGKGGRPFEAAEFAFRPGVVNVIVGQNGSGKSQLIGAIVAALIGRPALRIEEDGLGPSSVDVCVGEGDVAEHLRLAVAQSNGSDVTIE